MTKKINMIVQKIGKKHVTFVFFMYEIYF